MSDLDNIARRHPLSGWRTLAWLVMLLAGAAFVWAHMARLEEVAIAEGEVVPQGQIRVVQHLEGGIVQAIHVAEGTQIKAGTPLVQLDLAAVGMNNEELEVRLDGLLLSRARLEAESKGTKLALPADEANRRPALAARERETYDAHLREQKSVRTGNREKISQRQHDIRELAAKRDAVKGDLELSAERFKMSSSLLERGLISKMEHLENKRNKQALEGRIKTLNAQMPRARAALAEMRESAREAELKFSREANDELRIVEVELARTRELLARADEQESRTLIISPIDGVVKNLRYHTIGGVVKPGEAIMEIVPMREKLIVEARLNPIDRGYVEEGQPVVVKVSSYDFVRYGGLDGRVKHIAGDANSDADGVPYFRVVVETDKSYLGVSEGALPIIAGMQATVDIHTGDKSVLEYLVKPVLKLKHEAFRER
jgi:adhesin transport system membrane fusion protein